MEASTDIFHGPNNGVIPPPGLERGQLFATDSLVSPTFTTLIAQFDGDGNGTSVPIDLNEWGIDIPANLATSPLLVFEPIDWDKGKNTNNDFLVKGATLGCTGAIGDFVWNDLNKNGLQDAGEPGINGVTVNLTGPTNATTTTMNNPVGGAPGYYQFTGLCAGEYKVEVGTVPGLSPTTPCSSDQTIGNDSNCSPQTVHLVDNTSNETIDFGFKGPIECNASIGDFVWQDLNGNGIQDVGELGVPGATVNLLDCSNNLLRTTTTDANGIYGFGSLCAGSYVVEFVAPGLFTIKNAQGPDPNFTNNNDSNADPATGKTDCIPLAAGQNNPTIDAGILGELLCPPEPIEGFTGPAGTLFVTQESNGDVSVRYDQSLGLNDNSYGANAIGWPHGHTFGNLVGSDKAEFIFFDKNGNKVLDFFLDYISESPGTPSGFASLGPFGGDGKCVLGDCLHWVLNWNTSLAMDLNNTGYCSGGVCTCDSVDLLVDSPPVVSDETPVPACDKWNFVDAYQVMVSAAAFGTAGFGHVEIGLVHNSPSKAGRGAITPEPCVPEQPCSIEVDHVKLEDKHVKFKITNTGSSTITLTGLTFSWPAANGDLKKIKLGGDTVFKGPASPPSLTLTSSDLLGDVKKLSIKPGKTEQLELEFQNNISKDLSLYSGSFQFGNCTVEFPPTPPSGQECVGGVVAFTVEYTGAPISGPTTLTFTGSSGASANYDFPNGLATGTVLSLPSENGFTLDATAHGQTKLGTKTNVFINDGTPTEIFHTSCSCKENNFIPDFPACLDASSPDNSTGVKGAPSPLFEVISATYAGK